MRKLGWPCWVCAGIVSLWVVFIGWLVWEEYGQGASAGNRAADLPPPVLCDAPQGHRQMGVYVGGRRVGRMVQQTVAKRDRTVINVDVSIDLAKATGFAGCASGTPFPARITGQTVLRNGALRAFDMTVNLEEWDSPFLSVNLHVWRDTARLSVQRGLDARLTSFPLDPECGLGLAGWPLGDFAGLCAEGEWQARVFNPMSMRFEDVRARVVGRHEFAAEGEPLVASVVQVGDNALATRLWIDERGEVLRQQAMGFDLIREALCALPAPPADVLAGDGPGASLPPAPIARGGQ